MKRSAFGKSPSKIPLASRLAWRRSENSFEQGSSATEQLALKNSANLEALTGRFLVSQLCLCLAFEVRRVERQTTLSARGRSSQFWR